MTPAEFIAKWQANTRNEAAASKEHFLNLCELLGVPSPNSDATGATYAFEKGVTKATGGGGWADVWKRGCFGWEYKSRGADLNKAHDQLLRYAGALENPPLLVSSDMDRIVIRTNWTNVVSETIVVDLDDLRDAAVRQRLAAMWTEPDRWRPGTTRQALTEKAAGEFAALASVLGSRGHDAGAVALFVIRLVFCLFADDVGLLPAGLFERMLGAARKNPERFQDYAERLFRAMAEPGGEVDFTPVQWFNGGLFDEARALPLEEGDVHAIERAAALDWAEVDPSIMGTLFERGLDPAKRGQLGAHYTDRDKIMRIVGPVVADPLATEWERVRGEIAALMERSGSAKSPGARTKARNDATATLAAFLDRLRAFRVLDPACGSGNFLYLSLLALKDLEHRAMVEAEALGLQREFPQVGPEAVLGIEMNPYAAELARVSVWIGHIQWARRHGFPAPANPVLRPLHTIECRDAVLAPDGVPAAWPKANAIVGNPPFLGNKRMLSVLTDDYVSRLRAAYASRVRGSADLVCYWFERAREAVVEGHATGVGFVATQSIRKGGSREVLDRISASATIFEAWSDQPWAVEGADVRVSIVCFAQEHVGTIRLDGLEVSRIFADLTAGDADLTDVPRLSENAGICFQGCIPVGPFDVPGTTARTWLSMPPNANGRPNADVLRPWANADAITGRWPDIWVVDFGTSADEASAAFYAAPFAHLVDVVKPKRSGKREAKANTIWWRFQRSRPAMRRALTGLQRYIATPRVATHRLFVWFHSSILADTRVCVFARDDDTTFGVLHSRFHEVWALRQASRHGVGNDPTYNHPDCFETFPFPDGLTPNIDAAAYANDPRAQRIALAAQTLVEAREQWLNPPELLTEVPEVRPGFPSRLVAKDATAARDLKARTLTALYNTRGTSLGAWLDNLHRSLDEAVSAAYGWPLDISDEDAQTRLLALNLARAGTPAP